MDSRNPRCPGVTPGEHRPPIRNTRCITSRESIPADTDATPHPAHRADRGPRTDRRNTETLNTRHVSSPHNRDAESGCRGQSSNRHNGNGYPPSAEDDSHMSTDPADITQSEHDERWSQSPPKPSDRYSRSTSFVMVIDIDPETPGIPSDPRGNRQVRHAKAPVLGMTHYTIQ
jgi:hypothetical protein